MKMIWAVIPPLYMPRVIRALDHAGFGGMTRLPVTADGQNGLVSGEELLESRDVLMMAVPDNLVPKAVTVIRAHARTEHPAEDHGNVPAFSGRIFITPVDESFTIRTAARGNRGEMA